LWNTCLRFGSELVLECYMRLGMFRFWNLNCE
jgi:hypothetical protein